MFYTRTNRQPSKAKIISSIPSMSDIPWAEGAEIYDIAANEAAELATLAFRNECDRGYDYFIKQKEIDWELNHPESGSYEGNMREEYPQQAYPPTPDLANVKRTAGQRAYIEKFLVHYNLGSLVPKALPEIVDMLGRLHVERDSSSKVSGLQFCKDHFNTPERMGIFRLLTLNSKSDFLEKQYKGDGRNYCALVPIIMYAQRKAKNIKYSEWNRDELKYIMHSKLAEAMLWEGEVPSREQLLADRDISLKYQSGTRVGQDRDPVTTYKLFGTRGTCYEGMPEYVGVMLSQIWCAHPNNRTKYMVLDPINWDNVPQPLVNTEVFYKQSSEPTASIHQEDNPWI